jgi:filamentous hemagglutinin family protein
MQSLKWRIATSALIIVFFNPALGEISLDGTVGPKATLDGPDYTIPHTVGSTAGTNLFHSFDRFDIAKNESATFTGPAGLDNVISRVTGDDCSNIDGLLRSTIPGADFWFINPSGVFFGPDAQVNVPAAFHVSTADEIRFSDGSAFNAAEPNAGPLSVASPEAFGFISQNPAGISFQGSKLEVAEGNTLSIVGGDITMKGGSVTAPSGRINVASIASPGEIKVGTDNPPADLTTKGGFARLGKIDLSDSATISTDPIYSSTEPIAGGGTVVVRGGRLVVDGSTISSDTGDMNGAPTGIDIKVTDDINLINQAWVTTDIAIFGAGNAGNINVSAASVNVTDGSRLSSSGIFQSTGNPGAVSVDARTVSVSNGGKIQSNTGGKAGGKAGGVTINATSMLSIYGNGDSTTGIFSESGSSGPSAFIIDPTRMNWVLQERGSLGGIGDGGSMVIDTPIVSIKGGSISARTSLGNAGSISVKVDKVTLADKAKILTGTTLSLPARGAGNAGPITITATESINVSDDSTIQSGTVGGARAGKIILSAPLITLRDASQVLSKSFPEPPFIIGSNPQGPGLAADTVVTADTLVLSGGASIQTDTENLNKAGNVVISAKNVNLKDRAFIKSGTVSGGDAGVINITTQGVLKVESGSEITSSTRGQGNGGAININAATIDLSSVTLATNASQVGNAGNIILDATDSIQLADGSSITTEARQSSGGNIRLTAPRLIELIDSEITSSVFGPSETKGGNINIGTKGDTINSDNLDIDPRFLILDESKILAQAEKGQGGDIKVVSDYIIRSAGSDINAQAGPEGIDGTIVQSTPEIDLQKGLVELPVVFVDAASQVRRSCEARRSGGESAFTEAGRGGLPPEPDAGMPAFYILGANGNDTTEPAGGRPAEYERLTPIPSAHIAIVCGSLD